MNIYKYTNILEVGACVPYTWVLILIWLI
jgi:hypothetical protein